MVFVTNNSTPTVGDYVERLRSAGVAVEPHELVTSSQAAASIVASGSRAAFLGGPGVKEALESRSVEIVGPHEDARDSRRGPLIAALDFRELSEAAGALRSGARFVATNTDATFPTPDGLEPGAGALIAYLEVGSGKKAEVAGKPNRADGRSGPRLASASPITW